MVGLNTWEKINRFLSCKDLDGLRYLRDKERLRYFLSEDPGKRFLKWYMPGESNPQYIFLLSQEMDMILELLQDS